jgi:hypothetical protein
MRSPCKGFKRQPYHPGGGQADHHQYCDGGGSLVGPGTLTVPAGGTLLLAPRSELSGIDLVNHGQVTVAADASFDAVHVANGATLENTGSLTLADGSILNDDNGVGSGNKLVNDAGATITYPGAATVPPSP